MANVPSDVSDTHGTQLDGIHDAQPYDWDDYEAYFRDKPAYHSQEEALMAILSELSFESVFEVGPGFGRITALILNQWPAVAQDYTLLDISEAMIEATSKNLPTVDFLYFIGSISVPLDAGIWASPQLPIKADLVLAVEVLMHIHPNEIMQAVDNLLGAISDNGCLVTVDWTVPRPNEPFGQNWRHDYPNLFLAAGARTIQATLVGLQTIYVVEV